MPSIDPERPRSPPRPPPFPLPLPRDPQDDSTGSILLAREVYPVYNLTQAMLQRFLRSLFGQHDFRLAVTNDEYHMTLPRKFSEEEKRYLKALINEQKRKITPEAVAGQTDTAAQDSDIPLLTPSAEGRLIISTGLDESSESTEGKKSYEVIATHLQSGSLHDSGYLYRARVSAGMTCEVYEITARWAWTSKEAFNSSVNQTVKLAVKRLSRNTTLKDLLREYNALQSVKKRPHPNIVEVLSAFRYGDQDVHYNLSFPLASGNLKHLFRGSLHNTIIDKQSSSLWSQFEGLAGAIAYLHDDCQIAHTDLKPSNILLYETEGVPPLVCRIADFGLAVDLLKTNTWALESQEAKSAWKYDPPEVRSKTSGTKSATFMENTVVSAKQYKCADIWKLGAVFTELSTFLVFGSQGVTNFRRSITTSRDNIISDALSDSLFDDGVKVKWEVLNAIRILCQCNPFVAEIQDLLEQMLAEDIKRPSAGLVWKTLTETSFCSYFDYTRQLTFTRPESVARVSWVDKIKERTEAWLGGPIDWWPLKQGHRTCPPNHLRITWQYSSHTLYVDVPVEAIDEYKRLCTPISQVPAPAILPLHIVAISARQEENQTICPNSQVPYQPTSSTAASGSALGSAYSHTSALNLNRSESPILSKEIYWCVDRSWTEPKQTNLCSIENAHQISDDSIICQRLMQEYQRIRTWKGRIFSWKRCLGVEFINFKRVLEEKEGILKIAVGLPTPDVGGYEYSLHRSEVVHMALASEQLIIGMHYPQTVAGTSTTLSMIPKSTRTPLSPNTGAEGWGLHALQRFSLIKIMWWLIALTLFGLVFVICWLSFVSKTDLQNAFIPFTFLAGMVMIGLAVPQLLEID